MDNLDYLSDDELRHRLLQYGFPNLPVTETTRKVLIKKLRNQLENEKSKLKRSTTYATRYSSGEESDDSDRRRTNHRTTVTGGASGVKNSMPPPALSTNQRTKRNTTSPRITYITSTYKETTNSMDVLQNKIPIQPRSSVYVSPVIVNESEEDEENDARTSSNIYDRYKCYDDQALRLSPSNTLVGGNTNSYASPLSYNRGRYDTGAADPASTAHLRNRYSSISTPIYNTSASSASPYKRDEDASMNGSSSGGEESSPYVSDLTKRLLKLRGETVKDSANQRNSSFYNARRNNNQTNYHYQTSTNTSSTVAGNGPIDENDIVCHAEPSPEPQTVPLNIALTNLINKLDEYYGVKQTFVPCLLVSALILFFVFVGFMYMTISPDIVSTLNEVDTSYKFCNAQQSDHQSIIGFGDQPGIDCIEKNELQPALDTLKTLTTELQRRVEHNKCVDSDFPFIMTSKEIVHHYIEMEPNLHIMQTMKNIHNIEYLVEQNPQWRIRNVDGDGNVITMKEIIEMRPSEANALAILSPKLPFTCSLYKKTQTFFMVVGGIGMLAIFAYLVNLLVKFLVFVKQSRREQITNLINDITSAVMEQAAKAQQQQPNSGVSAQVVVNHLRDKLIPPLKRKELEWAWLQAIKYLEQNESRIQFEVGTRNGEDCKMMRWIDTINLNLSFGISGVGGVGSSATVGSILQNRSAIKKWQGPAFDKTNKIKDPPTTCLKIRQMFDKYDANDVNLKAIVQDAILEKVGTNCHIHDLQIDKSSCCVYLRCATTKDAGQVYDEINGWWFDNRLVSIKFLRLERYTSRFPSAASGPLCLKPSNSNNLSMSQYNNSNSNNLMGGEDEDEENDDDD